MAGYKFLGDPSPDGPFLNSVPKRDLALEEFQALEPSAQAAVVAHIEMYERIPDDAPAASTPEAPASTPFEALASDPLASEPRPTSESPAKPAAKGNGNA